jgi:hypothetical protein
MILIVIIIVGFLIAGFGFANRKNFGKGFMFSGAIIATEGFRELVSNPDLRVALNVTFGILLIMAVIMTVRSRGRSGTKRPSIRTR